MRLKLLNRHTALRVRRWLDKLSAADKHAVFMKCRNDYAALLLLQLKDGQLEEPFNSEPPGGPLPNLPQHLRLKAQGRPAHCSKQPQKQQASRADAAETTEASSASHGEVDSSVTAQPEQRSQSRAHSSLDMHPGAMQAPQPGSHNLSSTEMLDRVLQQHGAVDSSWCARTATCSKSQYHASHTHSQQMYMPRDSGRASLSHCTAVPVGAGAQQFTAEVQACAPVNNAKQHGKLVRAEDVRHQLHDTIQACKHLLAATQVRLCHDSR